MPKKHHLSDIAIIAISWCVASYVVGFVMAFQASSFSPSVLLLILFAPVTVPCIMALLYWFVGNPELPVDAYLWIMKLLIFGVAFIVTLIYLYSTREEHDDDNVI